MGQYFSVLNDDDGGGIEYSDLTQNIPTVQAVDVSLNELFGNEEPNADSNGIRKFGLELPTHSCCVD